LSAKDALALVTRAQEQQARVILVGDTRQLSAVEAGNPFKSLQQAGMATAYLTQSLRQKNQQIKSGVDLIAEGKIAEGVHQLKPYIHQVESEAARAQAIARDYLALDLEERQKTLLLAGTNRERAIVTQLIRQGLKAEGQLGEHITAKRLKARDLTEVQASYAHHVQVGNVLIPNAHYKRLGLERGQRYEVIAVDTQQNALTLRAEQGAAIQVDPARIRKKSVFQVEPIELAVGDRLRWTRNDAKLGRRNGQEFEVNGIEEGQVLIRYGNGKTESLSSSELAHLDYALVSTTYGAQGKSASRVIGALDRYLGRESFYVTVSRVKNGLKLYTSEDLDQLVVRVEKTRAKENPSDSLISKMETSTENCNSSFSLFEGLKPLELMPQAMKISQINSIRKRQNKQTEPEC
jgi:ATP-dependent exoDNAse (exonuclease V) alpha subunit